jgi:hypothetical protein
VSREEDFAQRDADRAAVLAQVGWPAETTPKKVIVPKGARAAMTRLEFAAALVLENWRFPFKLAENVAVISKRTRSVAVCPVSLVLFMAAWSSPGP